MLDNSTSTKICSKCHVEKPVYEFHKLADSKDGYRGVCKLCRSIREGHRYVKPAPPGFKWCRRCDTLFPLTEEHFYRTDTQKDGFYSSCKKCHTQRTRDWQAQNPEHFKFLLARWQKTHPDLKRRYWQNWKQNHPGNYSRHMNKLKSFHVIWSKEHPDQVKALQKRGKAKRRALEYNAPGSHTAAEVLELYRECDDHCQYCGIRLFGVYEEEHQIPLSRGGSNDIENIFIACPDCNRTKHDKTLAEWQAVRGW